MINPAELDLKEESVIRVTRVAKVTSRGKNFRFGALVAIGDGNGHIGIGQGKSKQVPDAIKKATEVAKKNMIKISLKDGRTLHHDIYGRNGSGKVLMRSAPTGTGIIAGGPVRAVCEVLGVKDIVAKSMGTSNPHNVIRATMKAFAKQNSPNHISTIRNKKISEVIEKRG